MRATLWSLILAVPAFFAGSGAYADALPNDGIQVLLRGPVHEAFAQPVNQTPVPGVIVPKQPPEPIIELPPDQRPAGDNVVWIPGYWSWDSDTANFIWVSGFWRVPPPGRTWMPGYWNPVAGGWQWVSGYWAVNRQPAVLLGAPPASLEAGPTLAAPAADSMYVPGCWLWNGSQYAWRPGYWAPGQADWVWTPAQYHWTPAGCNFVDGYWDYPLERRGMLLAPVAFERPIYAAPGWRYQPTYAVNLAGLCGSLFIRPAYCSYYFGDYYGPDCLRAGFQPWCVYGPRCYDPLFTYAGWSNRNFPDWQAGLLRQYDGRLKGEIPRPPRTVALQDRLIGEHGGDLRLLHNTSDIVRKDGRNNDVLLQHMLTPLGQIKRVEGRDMGFVKVSPAERDRFAESVKEYRKVADTRRVAEKPGTAVRRVEPRVEDHRAPGGVNMQTGPQVRIANAPPTVNIPAVHPATPTVATHPGTTTTTSPTHMTMPEHTTPPAHTTTPTHTTTTPMHTPTTPAHTPTPTHTTTPGVKSSTSSPRTSTPSRTTTPRTTTTRSTPRTTTTRSAPRSTPARSATSRSSSPAGNSGSRGSSGGRSSSGHSSSGHSGKK